MASDSSSPIPPAVRRAREPRRAILLQALRGFCMGAADIVPGVSGGTVALVFGIYERLVRNVRTGAGALGSVVRLDLRGGLRRLADVEWRFMAPLLVGIGAAVLTLARLIRYLLDEHPVETAAVFFGLVAASMVVAWRILRRPAPRHVVVVVVVAAVAFVVLGVSGSTVSEPSAPVLLGSGALAICAMILPGVSGSFILLMLGMYDAVIDAVDERQLGTILVFGAGAVLGLALFSTVLDWLLTRYHDVVVAALVGLMLGSLRVLWPWPPDEHGEAGAELGAPPSGEWLLPLVLAVVAGTLVVLVARVSARRATLSRP